MQKHNPDSATLT